MKGVDKQRVKNDVDHSARKNGDHAVAGISLRIDEAVHSGGDHGEGCSEKIDLQIGIRVRIGSVRGTEEKQDRPAEHIAEYKQDQRRYG